MSVEQTSVDTPRSAVPTVPLWSSRWQALLARLDRLAGSVFIWPTVLVVLFLSIFPLVISLYLSLSRFKFVKGGFEIRFAGLANYRKLLFGSEQAHFLGVMAAPSPLGWCIFCLLYTS
ncbi:MAG: sugar ABC transporter permease, partial [Anaerolineae bacterium]|nr:sugar ABC transporter permease [Anaerolineae bacterium]